MSNSHNTALQIKILNFLNELYTSENNYPISAVARRHKISSNYPVILKQNNLIISDRKLKTCTWNTIKPNLLMVKLLIDKKRAYDKALRTKVKPTVDNDFPTTSVSPIDIERLDEIKEIVESELIEPTSNVCFDIPEYTEECVNIPKNIEPSDIQTLPVISQSWWNKFKKRLSNLFN